MNEALNRDDQLELYKREIAHLRESVSDEKRYHESTKKKLDDATNLILKRESDNRKWLAVVTSIEGGLSLGAIMITVASGGSALWATAIAVPFAIALFGIIYSIKEYS